MFRWKLFLISFCVEKLSLFQDAAIKDLEHAIAFDGKPTFLDGRKGVGAGVQHPHGEEEEEISPPPDMKEEGKEQEGHRCARCGKSFSRLSLLNR